MAQTVEYFSIFSDDSRLELYSAGEKIAKQIEMYANENKEDTVSVSFNEAESVDALSALVVFEDR